jgi:hypothetical protein
MQSQLGLAHQGGWSSTAVDRCSCLFEPCEASFVVLFQAVAKRREGWRSASIEPPRYETRGSTPQKLAQGTANSARQLIRDVGLGEVDRDEAERSGLEGTDPRPRNCSQPKQCCAISESVVHHNDPVPTVPQPGDGPKEQAGDNDSARRCNRSSDHKKAGRSAARDDRESDLGRSRGEDPDRSECHYGSSHDESEEAVS